MVQVGETYISEATYRRRRNQLPQNRRGSLFLVLGLVLVCVGVGAAIFETVLVSSRVSAPKVEIASNNFAAQGRKSELSPRASLSQRGNVHSGQQNPAPQETLKDDFGAVIAPPPQGSLRSDTPSLPAPPQTSSIYRIQKGDTLAKILRQVGLTGKEAHEAAVQALKLSGNRPLKVGLSLTVVREADGSFVRLDWPLPAGRHIVIERSAQGDVAVVDREVPVIKNSRTERGTIDNSLFSAATARGVPVEIIDALVDALGSRIEFSRDLQPGDAFIVKFTEQRTAEGRSLEVGELLSAAIYTKGQTVAAIAHRGADGTIRFFDERGEALGSHFLRYPLQFSRISSTFTEARYHPLLRKKRRHPAVDFAAARGTPVRSIGDGVVTVASARGDAGNMVRVRHGSRYETVYRHLHGFAKGVRVGSKVTRGQVIGYVGSTGLSTGPHLCFSLFDRGRYINPLTAKLPAVVDEKNRIPAPILTAALHELNAEKEQVVVAHRVSEGDRKSSVG